MRVALVVLGLLVLLGWLALRPDPALDPLGAGGVGSAPEATATAATAGETARRQRFAPPGAPTAAAANPAPPGRPAGRLRVTVVDAADGTPIDALSYRIASDTRWAQLRDQNPLDVRVSTGEYRIGVHADGYDSLVLGPTSVEVDAVTDLGTVLMSRGTGVIEGRVLAGSDPVPGCEVELHGRAPPPVLTTVGGDGCFRFERLAGGVYHVLARRDDVVERAVRVDLEPRGSARVDLMLDDHFTLNVQVVDGEKRPFDGWWIEKGTTYYTVIRLHFAVAGVHVGDAVIDPVVPGGAAANPLGAATDEPTAPSGGGGTARPERPEVADRPRPDPSAGALWPRPFPPRTRLASLRGERITSGLYRVTGLPTAVDEVVVSCGPHFTSSESFEAAPRAEVTVVMPPLQKCTAPTALLLGAMRSTPDRPARTTCASCHEAPRTLGFSK